MPNGASIFPQLCGGTLTETEERRRQTKTGFATKRECLAEMNTLLVAVEKQTYTAPTKATVREYLTRAWLPAVKATIRPTTHHSYVQHVECHVVPHIGSVKLHKLTGSQVNAMYAQLAEHGGRNGRGLSPRTIHYVHACLHKACKDAVRPHLTASLQPTRGGSPRPRQTRHRS